MNFFTVYYNKILPGPFMAAAERPQDFRKDVAAAQLPAERSEAA